MVDQRPTILITGGEGELAQSLACVFEANQWKVLQPGRAELDVQNEDSVRDYFARHASIEILINNAGVIADDLLTRISPEQWNRVLATNLRGCFLCSREAVVQMLPRQRGQILFIGSRSARTGPVGQSAYSASKAGLIGLSQSLAREYGSNNLRFNVVLPGFLETRMTARMSPALRQAALESHVLGRFNTPKSAANSIWQITQMENLSGQLFQLDSRIDPWT